MKSKHGGIPRNWRHGWAGDGIPNEHQGGAMAEITERRNLGERAEIVRGVVNAVVQNPSVTLTAETLEVWLNVPSDAAQRILGRLASSGIVREIKKGVFVRASGMGSQPFWH
jgi:hypothetical protein